MTTEIDFDLKPAWLDKVGDSPDKIIVVMDEAGLEALPAGARFLDSTDEVMTKLDDFTFEGFDDNAIYGIGELAREYLPGAVLDNEASYARVGDTVEVTYAPLNRTVEYEIGTVTAINSLAPVLGYSVPFTVRLEDGEQYLVGAVYVVSPAVDEDEDEAIGLATFEGVSADLSWTDFIYEGEFDALAAWERELLDQPKPTPLTREDVSRGDRLLHVPSGELVRVRYVSTFTDSIDYTADESGPNPWRTDLADFESVDETPEPVESFDLYLDTPPYVADQEGFDALLDDSVLIRPGGFFRPFRKIDGRLVGFTSDRHGFEDLIARGLLVVYAGDL